VGATDGFGIGGLVAVGNGGGGSSSTRIGDGEGFLVFEFPFVLSFALTLAPRSLGSPPASGEAEVLVFSLLLAA